jgi:UTP--glucose-1-phosphate uridylyltransferase
MSISEDRVWAYELEGERYDVGTLAGYLKATVALALRREDLRDTLRAFIEEVCFRTG